jgi:hypothetical protein
MLDPRPLQEQLSAADADVEHALIYIHKAEKGEETYTAALMQIEKCGRDVVRSHVLPEDMKAFDALLEQAREISVAHMGDKWRPGGMEPEAKEWVSRAEPVLRRFKQTLAKPLRKFIRIGNAVVAANLLLTALVIGLICFAFRHYVLHH